MIFVSIEMDCEVSNSIFALSLCFSESSLRDLFKWHDDLNPDLGMPLVG